MKKRTTRCLALLLAVVMVLSVMPVAMAEETTQTTWTKTTLSDIKEADTIAITMTKGNDTWVLPTTGEGKRNQPLAIEVAVKGSTLTTSGSNGFGWKIAATEGGYHIKTGSKYLYLTANNNGMRIGKTISVWSLSADNYLTAKDSSNTSRYLGVYNGEDWRCYDKTTGNIAGQTLNFWKLDAAKEKVATPTATPVAGEVAKGTKVEFKCKTEGAKISYKTTGEYTEYTDPVEVNADTTFTVKATKDGMDDSDEVKFAYTVKAEEPTTVPISTALAGEKDASFTVKGVVTLVDGQNYYLQDATGGICLRLAEKTSDINLGDTIIGSGKRADFNSLPQLGSGTFQKSSGLTLSAKSTTIGALTPTDVCTYVTISGVEVTEVYDNNGGFKQPNITVKDADGKTIQLYKAVINKVDGEWEYKVGDKLDITAAVSIYSEKLQLRNTKVEEVKLHSDVYDPVSDDMIPEGALNVKEAAAQTSGTITVVGQVVYHYGKNYNGKASIDSIILEDVIGGEIYGYQIYDFTNYAKYVVGDIVKVTGTASPYGGVPQLKPSGVPEVIKSGLDPIAAQEITVSQMGADYLSEYVYIKDVTLGTYNKDGNTTVTDKTGTKNLFKGVPLPANTAEADVIAVYACCSAFKTNYQLRNGSSADYVTNTTPPPSGDLPKPGDKFVIYNQNAQAVLAAENDSKSIDKADTEVKDGKATPANGAVVFTVEQNGEYLRFKSEAYGYLCSNGTGNNAFYSKDFSEEGVTTDDADWLVRTCSGGVGGYEMESRTAKFNNRYSQWLEYYSDSFKTYSMDKSKVTDYTIYSFFFYPVADGVNVDGGLVVQPTITFPETMLPAYVGSNYEFELEIDTIYAIDDPWIEYSVKKADGTYIPGISQLQGNTDVEVLDGFTTGKGRVHITVFDSDIAKAAEAGSTMTLTFAFKDIKGNEARASYTVDILDEPVISNVTPAQGAQTGENKKPTISAEIVNAGENASVTMTVNGEKVDAAYANGKVTYTPAAAMADGKVTVTVTVKRADEKETSKTWSFTIGEATFQRYFGQLHSHTQYSDGAGSLDSALAYVKALPDNANVDFVAFTDHSNYFDSKNNPNVEAALYDTSLVKDSDPSHSWATYKNTVAAFNAANAGKMVAIAGFEMTWSGGPGHINTFNTPGIVSRNNTTLNNKTKDAGLQAYYKLLSQKEGANSISQFNHPGTTFGNFVDFGYWDAVVDTRMYMVEVGNGEGQIGAGGYYPSYEQYIMALDKGWHVAPTNNQDNHKGRWGNANDARDVILTDDFTEDGIYAALRARRMYATEDKNLELDYTVNGNMMGSIIDVPEKLNFEISFNDPDRTDSIAKVELVVNSGKVAYTWDSAADLAKGSVSVELAPEYTYYFVRVTEGDGDLAVTAPVWVGESLKLGISKAECGTSTPVTDEELTITTTFFNSEAKPATIKSITYAIGGETIGTATDPIALAASSTQDVEFKYTPTKARIMTVRITAVIEQDSKEYTFTKDVTLDVLDASKLVYIGIDASHYNEYVAGNYKDSMGNFGELAAAYSVRTVTLKTSEELIAACGNPKYKAIILTAPSRRLEAAQKDPKTYSEDELNALKTFNDNGGMVILAGWSDNYENYPIIQNNPDIKHMAATQNEVLAKLGSSLRISDDATYDDVRSAADGVDKWRLYFSTYNMENPLLNGVEFDAEHPYDKLYTERFSHYGGASIYAVDASGNATSTLPATVSPAVYGHATTYSVDVDSDGLGGAATPKYAFAENDDRLMVMASEQLEGKGLIIVSGAAFMSNFEVQYQVSDSGAEKNYSNYKICQNLVSMLNQTEITKIADVQAEKDEGVKFTVEGIVTSNASGYDKDTAFFDCIYVQDNTAGINAFPVAGNFKIGDKVRVTGTTSSYQGERQLAVTKIEKIADAAAPTPVEVTAAQINDGSVLGSLVKIKGTITRVEEAEGKIQTIMVRDAAGKEARVFIDGYITKDKEVQNAIVGNQVEAVGLASYDNTFVLSDGTPVYPRIRIRDRADVVCTAGETPARTWNITYVTDGGTIGGLYPVTYTESTVTVLPTNVTKPGYTFLGWFTAYTGGVQVRQIEATETGDKTFYARWQKTVLPPPPVTPGTPVTPARPAAPVGLPFADVSGSDWFYNDVRYVYEKGIMDGTGADRFSPNAPLTRAMIVTILYRMAGSPSVSGSSDFTDVAAGKWFAKAVAWAAANGIVNGYGDSLFGPNDPVTREQLAAILYRYAVYGGMTAVTLEENLGSFADTAQLSAYAIQAMNWAVGQGLINGSGSNLVPKAQATRAQVAAIIHRYLER